MTTIFPRTQVPDLKLPQTTGETFNLKESLNDTDNFVVLLFYRGYHCPVCKSQLQDWNARMEDFRNIGTKVIAISADSETRAKKTSDEWDVGQLPIAYDLSFEKAREWGLFISGKKEGSDEPDYFTEPGMFIIRPSGELYSSAIQTMPFTRPQARNVVKALKYIMENDYPARGEVQSVPATAEA